MTKLWPKTQRCFLYCAHSKAPYHSHMSSTSQTQSLKLRYHIYALIFHNAGEKWTPSWSNWLQTSLNRKTILGKAVKKIMGENNWSRDGKYWQLLDKHPAFSEIDYLVVFFITLLQTKSYGEVLQLGWYRRLHHGSYACTCTSKIL